MSCDIVKRGMNWLGLYGGLNHPIPSDYDRVDVFENIGGTTVTLVSPFFTSLSKYFYSLFMNVRNAQIDWYRVSRFNIEIDST